MPGALRTVHAVKVQRNVKGWRVKQEIRRLCRQLPDLRPGKPGRR